MRFPPAVPRQQVELNTIIYIYEHWDPEWKIAEARALSELAGGFITMGALFSVLLATQVEAEGPKRLLEGLGFSTGFFFVVLAGAVLFTEANVVLPTI